MPQPKPPSSNEKLLILVPKPGVDVRPVTGSGIVGSYTEKETGLVKIDYEGNLYHAGNLNTFCLRLFQAAGRHVQNYPTVAREYHTTGKDFPFIIVGTLDYTEAVQNIRARDLPQTEAISRACQIDPAFYEMLQKWAGEPI